MTLSGRNTTTRTVFSFMLVLVIAVGAYLVIESEGRVSDLFNATDAPLWAISAGITAAVVGLGASFAYLRLFKRTSAISVFFIVLFLELMIVDVVKTLHLFRLESLPYDVGLTVGRVLLAGHIAGVMALFGAGVYASGVRFQRHGAVLAAGLLLAGGLAIAVPLDPSELGRNLIHAPAISSNLAVITGFLPAIAVVSYLQNAVRDRDSRLILNAVAVGAMALGRELLFYAYRPWQVISGSVVLLVGAVMYARRNYRDFIVG